jgi:hypothetical protein
LSEISIGDVLQRLAACQREIDGVQAAIPGFMTLPAQYPAFVNRVGIGPHADGGTCVVRGRWTVHMRLLVCPLESVEYAGAEATLYGFMRTVPLHFAGHDRLQAAGLDPLVAAPVEIGAATGIQWFIDGVIYQHLGTEFPVTVTLPYRIQE